MIVMAESWDRQPDEPERAYDAFLVFRDLGPARSLSEAYRQKSGRRTAEKPDTTWNRWTKAYNWPARALAWDNHVSAVQTQAIDRATEVQAEEWVRRKAARAERDYQTAEDLSDRIDALIPEQATPRDLKDAAACATTASALAWSAINSVIPDPDADFNPITATDEELRAFLDRAGRRSFPRVAATG